jgi:hypothetical protein
MKLGSSNSTQVLVIGNEQMGTQPLSKHAQKLLHNKYKFLINFPRNLLFEETVIPGL